MVTLFGIPNCDTVKKAQNWLTAQGISHTLHNYKKEGVTAAHLKLWSSQVPWQQLLNKQSSTFKGLTEAEQAKAHTKAGALKLMEAYPTLIKRPVAVVQDKVLAVGFKAELWQTLAWLGA
ncbi:MAG TPA: Spx/MgsR family RNA polymerase-binding regulatory protein [Phnomibacter sp.]|nr:Spx/MgsR family RNA polymerase-binding regulatory protein [Phnomibacter sp.]